MKKTITLILILLSKFLSIQAEEEKSLKSFFPIKSQQIALFVKKNSYILAGLPLIYYGHHNINTVFEKHPIFSCLCLYFSINFFSDVILDYKTQQEILDVINLLKKIALYLVTTHGIKNHLQKRNLTIPSLFSDDFDFFNHLTHKLPYTFDEITMLSTKTYQELKHYIQKINPEIHIQSEEFVFLCYAPHLDIQTTLYITQQDPNLHNEIYTFEKNPLDNTEKIISYLENLITTTFITLEHSIIKLQSKKIVTASIHS